MNECNSDPTATRWIRGGALLAGLAVALGAYAAHGLDLTLLKIYAGQTRTELGETIPAARKFLEDFKTAAAYQMTHALALILAGLLGPRMRPRAAAVARWAFLLGILLFSGSLYLLVLTGITKLGMITPLGGAAFLVGWAALTVGVVARPGESPATK